MEFSRQEYWSGLPYPSPGDLPDPGIESSSPVLQADFIVWATRETPNDFMVCYKYFFYVIAAATAAKSLQSCLTLCDPILGILQARTLEWVAISFSNA